MLPNGLFGHLFGPHKGHRNDSFMLNESRIIGTCAEHAIRKGTNKNTPDKECFFQLFGDLVYSVSAHIQSPFGGERTEEQRHWNLLMSQARIVVENGFAIVSNHWPYLNASWKMQLGSSL